MARSTIKVEGQKNFRASLARLGRASAQSLPEAVAAGGEFLAEEISNVTPFKTGQARENIVHVPVARKSVARASELVGPAPKAFYIRFIELGTKHISADEFMKPTVESKKNNLRDIMSAAYAQGIVSRI